MGECNSLTDKWCYALKHVGRLHDLPEELSAQAFERLFRACEIAEFSQEKKLQYEKDMITERDYQNIMATARERGYAEGQTETAARIAKAMLLSGMDVSQIAALTDLSEEDINNLR